LPGAHGIRVTSAPSKPRWTRSGPCGASRCAICLWGILVVPICCNCGGSQCRSFTLGPERRRSIVISQSAGSEIAPFGLSKSR
jgi:hypothetical protein